MRPATLSMEEWGGPYPEPGDLLRSEAGSWYLVMIVKPSRTPGRFRVIVERFGRNEPVDLVAQGAPVHHFYWVPRV